MNEDTQRERRRLQRAKEREGQTLVAVSDQHAASLRAFAADLGLFTTRGPRVGNIHALVERIADAAASDPSGLRRLLGEADDAEPELAAVA